MKGQKIRMWLMVVMLAIFSFAGRESFCFEKENYIDMVYFKPDRIIEGIGYGGTYNIFIHQWGTEVAGTVYIYLRNPSRNELTIETLSMNGVDISQLLTSPETSGKVIWYRILPNPIPAQGIAEVLIRLRDKPDKQMRIEFTAREKGAEKSFPIRYNLRVKGPSLWMGYIGFNSRIDKVYVYVENLTDKRLKVNKIYLDGVDVSSSTQIYGPDFPQKIAHLEISLQEPLRYGSYHTVKVTTLPREEVAGMVRAWDGFFVRGIFGVDFSRLGFSVLTKYQFNTLCLSSIKRPEVDKMQEFGFRVMSNWAFWSLIRKAATTKKAVTADDEKWAAESMKKRQLIGHPAIMEYFLWDEPDVFDYKIKRSAKEVGSMAMIIEKMADFSRRMDPRTLTRVEIDNTYKPQNWYRYGEIADRTGTDPYVVNFGRPLIEVYNRSKVCQFATSPRPMVITLGCQNAEHSGYGRFPTPEEERIMLYYALGAGAKGIEYFCYGSDFRLLGVEKVPQLLEEIGRLNTEVGLIAPLLAKGYPVDGMVSSSTELWTKALLCGKDSLILIIVNKNYTSEKKGFSYTPIEKAEVLINLPPWFEVTEAFAVSHSGFEDVKFSTKDQRLVLNFADLEVGKIVVLSRDGALSQRLLRSWEEEQLRIAKVLERVKKRASELAERIAKLREILATECSQYMLLGKANTYKKSGGHVWNPLNKKFNLFEWYESKKGQMKEYWVQWQVSIPEDRVNVEHTLFLNFFVKGSQPQLEVSDASQNVILSQAIGKAKPTIYEVPVSFPRAGDYTIKLIQRSEGYMRADVAEAAYLVPAGYLAEILEKEGPQEKKEPQESQE